MIINPYVFAGAPPPANYFDEVSADSPLAWWRLAELSGTSAANIGSLPGISGTYAGGFTLGQTTLCGDAGDFAIALDGINGLVGMGSPGALQIADNFTYEAIINASGSGERTIISYTDGGFALRLTTANLLLAIKSNIAGRGNNSTTIPNGSKAHVAVNVVSGVLTFVLNGFSDGNGTTAADYGSPSGSLRIGEDVGGTDHWNGIIDEVAIYSPAISIPRLRAHAIAAGL